MVRRHVWMSSAVLLMLVGCRHCSSTAVAPVTSPELLPASARGDFSADIQTLTADSLQTTGATIACPAYRLLLARQCQCLAADACANANILDLEGQAAVQKAEAKKIGHDKPVLKADVMTYLAMEERNKAAAKALDFYYRLAEAEAGADILQATLTQVGDTLIRTRELKAKGLKVAADDTALHSRQLELQSQQVKLRLQIQQFNGELRRLLAFEREQLHAEQHWRHLGRLEPPCDDWQFWPAEAFHVAIGCVEPQQAVAVGLENRPILLLLNLLETELAEGDPATVRRMLGAVNSILGQGGSCSCLKKLLAILCGTEDDRALRQQQLALYHADREREVVEDILHAVRSIQAQKETLLLAQAKAEAWHGRLKEAEDKESKGIGSFTDTADARVNWLKARRAIAEEITNMQRAWVQLRQAQGVLPLECSPSSSEESSPPPPSDPEIEVLPSPRPIMSK